jgi:hypothetical protein
MLNNYDASKLKNDLKTLARAIKVVADENDQIKRQFAKLLAEDIGNRIMNDIDEMTENIKLPSEYDGSGKLKDSNNEAN